MQYPIHGDKTEAAHRATKAVLGAIPLGSLAVELFSSVIASPLQKRRDEWGQWVSGELARLSDGGIKVELLADNEAFLDVVCELCQIAVRTSSQKKIRMIKTCLTKNMVDPPLPSELALRSIFHRMIDELTVVHFRVFVLLANPDTADPVIVKKIIQNKQSISPYEFIRAVIPTEFEQTTGLLMKIITDLENQRLIMPYQCHPNMCVDGWVRSVALPMGKGLLEYVRISE